MGVLDRVILRKSLDDVVDVGIGPDGDGAIMGARDVMPTAEVHPFYLRNEVSELCLNCSEGALERVAVLLAKVVKVQAVELCQLVGTQVGPQQAFQGRA